MIYGRTCGVFGQVFCDFGPSFTIFDVNGALACQLVLAVQLN
jgi:hypothetical protein